MKKQIDISTCRFGTYYRKSSESDDRQVQSIEDQERDITRVVERESLSVVKKFPGESQSAFEPGRPIFASVVDSIERGETNALLVWHPNRLARNPIDGGQIIYLMDKGKLLVIKTPQKEYYNTGSDKFFLQLELGISKKDSDDKSEMVKRGQVGKAIRGVPHGVAHMGFLNDKTEERGNRKWMIDPDRLPLIKILLEEFLKGTHSVASIHRFARDVLKLTTVQRKRQGGKIVSRSYAYTLLRDPIFAGFFYQDDGSGQKKRYEFQKDLPRIISEDNYWKMQMILGSRGMPRIQKREGLYNYVMRDSDGGPVTPDFKFQIICDCKHKFSYSNTDKCPKCRTSVEEMKKPLYLSYVYYYNARDRRGFAPAKGVEEKKVDGCVLDYYSNNVAISKELSDWCIKHIYELEDNEINQTLAIQESHKQAQKSIEQRLDALLDLRLRAGGVASKDDVDRWNAKEIALKQELTSLNRNQAGEGNSVERLEELKNKFSLMVSMLDILGNGNRLQRKQVIIDFGSNLTLKDGKVSICNVKEVQLFVDCLKKLKEEYPTLEPKNLVDLSERNELFTSIRPALLRDLDSNQEPID